jgi:ferrous iron transport protein B
MSAPSVPQKLRVALAGNPNSGKTSLFNALTGANQRVGNYPGITVERRVGSCSAEGLPTTVIDLPGTCSLAAGSPEERVAEQELLSGDLEVVVVVADATALNRPHGPRAQPLRAAR